MTSKEKFEKRLEELNLIEKWREQDCKGHIATERYKEIIVFRYLWKENEYFECTFPSYEELKKDKDFVLSCISYYSDKISAEDFKKLYDWLMVSEKNITDQSRYYIPDPCELIVYASKKAKQSVSFIDDKNLPLSFVNNSEIREEVESLKKLFCDSANEKTYFEGKLIRLLQKVENDTEDRIFNALKEKVYRNEK